MKKLLLPLLALILTCCGSKTAEYEQQIAQLQTQRDSLANVAEEKTNDYNEIFGYISGLETALDSIADTEQMLTLTSGRERGMTRAQMRENIIKFGGVLQRQRQYIKMLEDSLNKSKGSASHLLAIVSSLRSQLEQKESELARLQSSLNDSRRSMKELQQSFAAVTQINSELNAKANILETAVAEQTNASNIGYVMIASKKELQEMGILSKGGFLKKSKVNYSSFDAAKFDNVDIRDFRSRTFAAKKAKLITGAPASSYSLRKRSDNEWILEISSPADFWSISNFLVIQTD